MDLGITLSSYSQVHHCDNNNFDDFVSRQNCSGCLGPSQIRIWPQKSKRVNVFAIMHPDNWLLSFQREGSLKTDFIIECNQQANQVQLIQGDVLEAEKLNIHFKGCDIIISALGTGKDNSYTKIYSNGVEIC